MGKLRGYKTIGQHVGRRCCEVQNLNVYCRTQISLYLLPCLYCQRHRLRSGAGALRSPPEGYILSPGRTARKYQGVRGKRNIGWVLDTTANVRQSKSRTDSKSLRQAVGQPRDVHKQYDARPASHPLLLRPRPVTADVEAEAFLLDQIVKQLFLGSVA